MAATPVTGLTGSITLPGHTQEFFSVSINTGADLLDVSAYGSGGWRRRAKGIKDLAGTCAAFVSKDVANSNPFDDADGTMTILFDTGCSISFTALVGNRTIVGEYQGLNIVTFSWAKDDTGDPTIAWDESGS